MLCSFAAQTSNVLRESNDYFICAFNHLSFCIYIITLSKRWIILPILRVQAISTIKDDISAIKTGFKRWLSVFIILLFIFPSLKNCLAYE